LAARRLDSLICYRRMMLVAERTAGSDHGIAGPFAGERGEAKPLGTTYANDLAG
jgi:hypothetical protein